MTPDRFKPLLDRDFLKAELHYEYQDYCAGGQDEALREAGRADWLVTGDKDDLLRSAGKGRHGWRRPRRWRRNWG